MFWPLLAIAAILFIVWLVMNDERRDFIEKELEEALLEMIEPEKAIKLVKKNMPLRMKITPVFGALTLLLVLIAVLQKTCW